MSLDNEITKLSKRLEDLGGNIESAIPVGLLRTAQRVQADTKRLVPVDEGRARESVFATVEKQGAEYVAKTGSNLNYFVYLEFGTGPVGERSAKIVPVGINLKYTTQGKTITRKTKKGVLQYHIKGWIYKDPKTGQFRYTEGQPAKPSLYPSFKQNQRYVKEDLRDAIKNAIKGQLNG